MSSDHPAPRRLPGVRTTTRSIERLPQMSAHFSVFRNLHCAKLT
jgi:hypothetical protein